MRNWVIIKMDEKNTSGPNGPFKFVLRSIRMDMSTAKSISRGCFLSIIISCRTLRSPTPGWKHEFLVGVARRSAYRLVGRGVEARYGVDLARILGE